MYNWNRTDKKNMTFYAAVYSLFNFSVQLPKKVENKNVKKNLQARPCAREWGGVCVCACAREGTDFCFTLTVHHVIKYSMLCGAEKQASPYCGQIVAGWSEFLALRHVNNECFIKSLGGNYYRYGGGKPVLKRWQPGIAYYLPVHTHAQSYPI